jgi:hypothetical protein
MVFVGMGLVFSGSVGGLALSKLSCELSSTGSLNEVYSGLTEKELMIKETYHWTFLTGISCPWIGRIMRN